MKIYKYIYTKENIMFRITSWCLCLSSSLIVHDFPNKKLKRLHPDLKFIYHFIRNISDLKLKMLFLICGTLLYFALCSATTCKVDSYNSKLKPDLRYCAKTEMNESAAPPQQPQRWDTFFWAPCSLVINDRKHHCGLEFTILLKV